MTILEFFKTVHPSVLAAKMIFRYLQKQYPVMKIADIADTTSGGTPNRGMVEYYNGEIPWVKSGELRDGLIATCDEYITEQGLKNSSAKIFPKGTLLVAMYGANIGKTGVLNFDATTNQAVCAIFPKIDISKEYLYWYFKQQRIDFIAVGKGGAQPNISQTIINNASIVVPDDNVQKQIVAFLERIEKGNGIDNDFFIQDVLKDVETIYKYKNSYVTLSDSFKAQLTQLENLNQATLQEAVQGKLVPQDPNDEPATELLKRIKAERQKGLPAGAKRRQEKPLPPIKPEEIPFEIPENWVWCRLGEVCEIKGGKRVSNGYKLLKTPTPYIYIRVTDMKSGTISEDDIHYIDENMHQKIKQYTINKNDLYMTIVGATIGKCGIVPERFHNMNLTENAAKISPILIDKKFLLICLQSKFCQNQFIDKTKQVAVQKMALNRFSSSTIPLPPLSEQKRIVAEIEKQLAKTKQLKEHIIANQQATEQLLKALLHQAFEVKEIL